MNKQEAYNRVCEHLMTQKRKATESACRYRTTEGLKCAVGCLIPDEMYDSNIEGGTVEALPDVLLNHLGRGNIPLLIDLQVVHDTQSVGSWPGELASVGRKHSLEIPCVLKT